MLFTLPIVPNVVKDDTPKATEGMLIDSNNIRSVRNRVETVYGNELASASTITGIARGIFDWSDNSTNPWLAIGTSTSLTAMDQDGSLSDITPDGFTGGQVDGLAGLGYGVGLWSGSTFYSSPAGSQDKFPMSWSHDQFGQNLLSNPRGQGVFEWAPNVSAAELTSSFDNWSAGAGWTVSTTRAVAASANTTSVSTGISFDSIAAWHEVKTVTSSMVTGYVNLLINSSVVQSSISTETTTITYYYSGGGGTQNVQLQASSAFSGAVDDVSIQVLTKGYQIPNAPTSCNYMFVTAEGNVVALGVPDANGNVDPMLLQWSDRRNNNVWTGLPSNFAGDYTLQGGSFLVCGARFVKSNIIWSNTTVYLMSAVPDTSVVYRFDEIAGGDGIIGPLAFGIIHGRAYWMSPQVEFFAMAGGQITPLECPVRRDIADNISGAQMEKITCDVNSARKEITWRWPDKRDGNEVSRYVRYNYMDGTWQVGTTDRTAWIDKKAFGFPIAVDTSGQIHFEEKGDSNNGGPRTAFIETGWFDIGEGDTFTEVQRIIADFEDLQGTLQITLYTRDYPQDSSTEETWGPFNVSSTTDWVEPLAVGRQVKLRIEATDAPMFWRIGQMQLEIIQTGMGR